MAEKDVTVSSPVESLKCARIGPAANFDTRNEKWERRNSQLF